jgi:hypothetical protein
MELQTATEGQQKNYMAVMGKEGDTKHMWDPRVPFEVENARRTFDDFRKKGYAAFHAKGDKGERDVQMLEFDPNAGRIIFIPPQVGG